MQVVWANRLFQGVKLPFAVGFPFATSYDGSDVVNAQQRHSLCPQLPAAIRELISNRMSRPGYQAYRLQPRTLTSADKVEGTLEARSNTIIHR